MRAHRQLSNDCRSATPHLLRRALARLVEAREAACLQVRGITQQLRRLQVNRPADESAMYKCRDCQLQFPLASKLMAHNVYRHSDVIIEQRAKLPCPICKVRCRTKRTMSAHLGTHLGERLCEKCGAEFASAGAAAAHELFHPTAGNFACSQCQRQFARQSGLVEHSRVEHGLVLPHGSSPCLPGE
ncbi:uncharacterized protein LOC144095060 isoform X1 [Amblyomma americanum]|uniref:C2H2-type domain-containing protein n=1 Tax=Amblyomma americanum TaxID=6943 RepID=A0AAQ4E717_AMBAM